jgi:putative addiction module component (TIGR02574 family)
LPWGPGCHGCTALLCQLTIGWSDRGQRLRKGEEGVDDCDKAASFLFSAPARRSTSSLEVTFQAALRPAASTGKLTDMARPLATIEEEIRELSVADKETLLRVLWEELDGPADSEVDAEWLREAQRRSREIDDGMVECIPAEQVFARLETLIKK